jgi:hypothetical protein
MDRNNKRSIHTVRNLEQMRALPPLAGYSARPGQQGRETLLSLKPATDRISLDCQLFNEAEERRRLTQEQQVVGESLDRRHRSSILR